MLVLGLMSGTSADGVDAVLAEFSGNPSKPNWKIINLLSIPYPKYLQEQVIEIEQGKAIKNNEILDLNESITEIQAKAAKACDPNHIAEIVGCHGQTIFHKPPQGQIRGGSLQILQGPLLAQLLMRPVIFDFRAKDLALGGNGAPLVPLADAALIKKSYGWQALVNLGGIANLTFIPPVSGPNQSSSVLGWDCGPANSLLDLAMQKISQGRFLFDQDGNTASKGSVNEEAINLWLQEPFFQKTPPKSTGRELFGSSDLYHRLKHLKSIAGHIQSPEIMATLTAFSAAVIGQDIDNLYARESIRPIVLYIAGGGAKNPFLVSEIKRRCRGIRVTTINKLGIPCQAREPLAIALLAWWHSQNHYNKTSSITGARRSGVLGVMAKPS